ncbi:PEP-CTERM sorting domain-containing protein [filamentous cyanobacterium CCP5]|nr:PEP-CTERM sorting domain-containing protein [filamentous cyanobacterium CCP5]
MKTIALMLGSLAISGLNLASSGVQVKAALLVSGNGGNNVTRFDEITGDFLGEFIGPESGLDSPDTLLFGPDKHLYVSSGTTPENSTVFRFNGRTGTLIDEFATGGGLFRPYGLAFGPDGNLYVSSFLSDQILRYDGTTGIFLDVFAESDGTPEGLNGPNGLLFGPDNALYVTTQGSVAVDGVPDYSLGYPSQVLRYDLATGVSEVFIPQPPAAVDSFGFVSLLGLAIGPRDGNLYVSDYASDIYSYDFNTRSLIDAFSTNYTETIPSSNFIGSLAFGPSGDLFTVGFDFNSDNAGTVLRFDPETTQRSLFVSSTAILNRPIGLAFTPSIPEPSMVIGLTAVVLGLYKKRANRPDS